MRDFYQRVRGTARKSKYLKWGLTTIKQLCVYEEIVILRKRISLPPDHPEFNLVAHKAHDPSTFDLYQRLGRGSSEAHLNARYAQGLRFYELKKKEKTMATTWIVLPGRRFIDEVGYHFPVDEKALWLRDIFVLPHARGQRIFSIFLDILLHRVFSGARVMWSDTESKNTASLKAHLHYGFDVTDTLRVLHLAETVMFRLKAPAQVEYLSGFKVNRRVLYTGSAYRKYKGEHIA